MSSGTIDAAPGPTSSAQLNAPGLIARITPIVGKTPTKVLSHPIWLPALLNNITVTETALHNEYDTLSAGQFSQPAMGADNVGELRTVPLDSLILSWDPPWIAISGQNPIRLRNSLFGVLRSRKPVHLLVTWNPYPGGWPEIDMDVTMRSGTREIRPQENDTVYVSISFSEWRDPTVRVKGSRPAGGVSSRKRGQSLPASYLLQSGDTLYSISQQWYGSYRYWRDIRAANGIPVRFGGKTPVTALGGHFKVGAKLRIPSISTGSGSGVAVGGG